jgi:ribose 5-phosphate isomerase B
MKIAIGSTRAGLRLKESVLKLLAEMGHEVSDVGMQEGGEFVPYHESAANVARAVSERRADRGIAICGTGAGSVIVANKFRDVYAVHVSNQFEAEKAIAVNDCNLLVLGEWITPAEHAAPILKTWFNTPFGSGFAPDWVEFLRGAVGKIKELEDRNFR